MTDMRGKFSTYRAELRYTCFRCHYAGTLKRLGHSDRAGVKFAWRTHEASCQLILTQEQQHFDFVDSCEFYVISQLDVISTPLGISKSGKI